MLSSPVRRLLSVRVLSTSVPRSRASDGATSRLRVPALQPGGVPLRVGLRAAAYLFVVGTCLMVFPFLRSFLRRGNDDIKNAAREAEQAALEAKKAAEEAAKKAAEAEAKAAEAAEEAAERAAKTAQEADGQ